MHRLYVHLCDTMWLRGKLTPIRTINSTHKYSARQQLTAIYTKHIRLKHRSVLLRCDAISNDMALMHHASSCFSSSYMYTDYGLPSWAPQYWVRIYHRNLTIMKDSKPQKSTDMWKYILLYVAEVASKIEQQCKTNVVVDALNAVLVLECGMLQQLNNCTIPSW